MFNLQFFFFFFNFKWFIWDVKFHPAPMVSWTYELPQKQIIRFIFSNCRVSLSLCSQDKGMLSLPTFKRKQLRHELYPSQPHPPLGTSFLPLSRTDTFFCPESRHIYLELCSAYLNSHHSSCSFPFTFLFSFLHSSVVRCLSIAHWSHIQSPLHVANTKNTPLLSGFKWNVSFGLLFFSVQIWGSELIACMATCFLLDMAENKSPSKAVL